MEYDMKEVSIMIFCLASCSAHQIRTRVLCWFGRVTALKVGLNVVHYSCCC